jgi:hypothetical protein
VTGDYLWDGTGFADPDIVRLERVLGRLRFAPESAPPASRPVAAPRVVVFPVRRRSSIEALVAVAAAGIAMVALTRWPTLPPAPGLEVTRLAGTPTISSKPVTAPSRLGVGRWLETDALSRASIDIAKVGRVELGPDSRLGLVRTEPGDYRFNLWRGTVQALIFAPPGQFSMATPSSTAVDLGCIYSMTVDEDGVGTVDVTVGWVGFEWRGRESFIPADAECVTRPRLGPGTPYYKDTSDRFRGALATIDEGRAPAAAITAAVSNIIAEARPRDVVTLWHLLTRVDGVDRNRVFDALNAFVPVPAGVTREGIRAGTQEMLDRWWDKLDLGTASWWRVWKQQWRDDK